VRRELTALFVLVAVLLAGWGGYRLLFEAGGRQELTLDSVDGQVRHLNGTVSALAHAGEVVQPGERLEAGPDGAAVLSFGPDTRVALQPDSSLKVLDVAPEGVRVALEGGRVQATVREGGAPVAVRAGDREVTARDADVTVARGEDGTVAVSPSRGSVDLAGFGSAVQVSEGQRIVAPPGQAAAVVASRQERLLELAATPPRTNLDVVKVQGRTEPSASVVISGGAEPVRVKADGEGGFVATVRLREGQNRLELRATDLLGGEALATAEVERDTTAPQVQVEIH